MEITLFIPMWLVYAGGFVIAVNLLFFAGIGLFVFLNSQDWGG